MRNSEITGLRECTDKYLVSDRSSSFNKKFEKFGTGRQFLWTMDVVVPGQGCVRTHVSTYMYINFRFKVLYLPQSKVPCIEVPFPTVPVTVHVDVPWKVYPTLTTSTCDPRTVLVPPPPVSGSSVGRPGGGHNRDQHQGGIVCERHQRPVYDSRRPTTTLEWERLTRDPRPVMNLERCLRLSE